MLHIVAMKPDKLLEQAKATPEKRGLNAYSETIWELRCKGNSYRQIAEFLKSGGVTTDHTAVYRLIHEDDPDSYYGDGCVLIGDVPFESRKGRPQRPFNAGLFIQIKKHSRILPLNLVAPVAPIWCEAQFELNEAPNHCWLEKLCKCLNMDWNPKTPWHLQGRLGIELKFEGNLMAMVCHTFNLERAMKDVGTAITKATNYFQQDSKERYSRLHQLMSGQRAIILKSVQIERGESIDDMIEHCLKWNQEWAEKFTKQFNSIPIP